MITVEHKIHPKKFPEKLKEEIKKSVVRSLAQGMDIVAQRSISDFWIIGKVQFTKYGTVDYNEPPPDPRKLTARSGTLARALQDEFVFRTPFALDKSEWDVKKGKSIPKYGKMGGGTRQGERKIEKKGKDIVAILSVDKVESGEGKTREQYARKHEFGDRPFLAPALERSKNEITSRFKMSLEEVAKKFNMVK